MTVDFIKNYCSAHTFPPSCFYYSINNYMATDKNYTLITGGSMGIGLELAKVFAEHGHNLVLVARDATELAAAKEDIQAPGIEIITIVKDLFDPGAPFSLYEEIKSRGIRVDILVNNAGQGEYGLFAETDIRRELSIIQLNICSLIVLTKKFLQDMLA